MKKQKYITIQGWVTGEEGYGGYTAYHIPIYIEDNKIVLDTETFMEANMNPNYKFIFTQEEIETDLY